MIWLDWTFNSPQFGELTFDHWIVVEAVLVPIDSVCLTGKFVWQADLSSEFGGLVNVSTVFEWERAAAAIFNPVVDLRGSFDWQVALIAELKCES